MENEYQLNYLVRWDILVRFSDAGFRYTRNRINIFLNNLLGEL